MIGRLYDPKIERLQDAIIRKCAKAIFAVHTLDVFILPAWFPGVLQPNIKVSEFAFYVAILVFASLMVALLFHRKGYGVVGCASYSVLLLYIGWSNDSVLARILYSSFSVFAMVVAAALLQLMRMKDASTAS